MDLGLWILSALLAALSAVVTLLYRLLSALDQRDRALAEREADFETQVARDYVTKAEFNRTGEIVRAAVDGVNKRIDVLQKR